MGNESEETLTKLQLAQQNMHNLLLQRHQIQLQINEIQSALDALKDAEKAYKIIGNIMILTESGTLAKDLEEKKETLNIRITNIEKQEEKLKQKTKDMHEKVMGTLKEKEK